MPNEKSCIMSRNYKYQQKRKREMDENARISAFFWQYLYPIGAFVLFAFLASIPGFPPQFALLELSASLILPGIFILRSAVRWTRTFVFMMQLSTHGRKLSSLHMIKNPDKKMQREGILIGCIFIFLGCMLAFCTLHDIFFIL